MRLDMQSEQTLQNKADQDNYDDHIPVPRVPIGVASVVVFLVGVACFVNSYDADFAFDDSEAIINNKDINPDVINISEVFLHDFWGSRLNSTQSHKSYRPLTVITFRLNYWIANGLHPMGFHVVNIVMHGVVSSLFLIYFSLIAQDGSTGDLSRQKKLPLLCALMFAVHPVHTESVAAVVGRADLMCAICFLLAFISYAKSLHAESSLWTRCTFFVLVFPLVVCSILFKEQGITVLGVCAAYDILIVSKVHPLTCLSFLFTVAPLSSLKANHNKVQSERNTLQTSHVLNWRLTGRLLAVTVFGVVLLVLRWKVMGSQPPTFQPVDNPQSFINSTFYRVINYNYLYALNCWLLLNPWWLCFDWSMGCVPLIDRLTDPRLLPVLFFLLVFFSLLTSAVLRQPSSEQRFLAMSLALVILPFLPASNILFRVGFVIAERNLYLSSAGFIMIVGLGIKIFCRARRQACLVFIVFLLITYISRSIQRSSEWRKENVLFESGALVCPLNAKVHYNIAKLYADEGNVDLAIKKYKLAIRLNPQYDQAMNNLGNLYKDMGRVAEAESLLQKAVELRSDFSAAWMNLGIVQATLKKYRLAEESYLMAVKHRRKYPDCYYNLGNLYLDEGRHSEALTAWQNATFQKPNHLSAWTNMILLLDNLGRLNDLEKVVSIALQHNPNESSIHFNYASALGKASLFEQSEQHFLLAIKYNNKVATYHSNLGVLYHRWGKLDLAEKSYKTALTLEPTSKQTMENLRLLYKKLHRNL